MEHNLTLQVALLNQLWRLNTFVSLFIALFRKKNTSITEHTIIVLDSVAFVIFEWSNYKINVFTENKCFVYTNLYESEIGLDFLSIPDLFDKPIISNVNKNHK